MRKLTLKNCDGVLQQIAELRKEIKEVMMAIEKMSSSPQIRPNCHSLCEIERACEITRKAKSTIYAIARKGEIPAIKKGKNWFFYEDELVKWLEQGRREYTAEKNEEELNKITSFIRHTPKSLKNRM